LVDRVPLGFFLTKMAAVASEIGEDNNPLKFARHNAVALRGDSSQTSMHRKSGAGRRLRSPPGMRRMLYWGGRAAAAGKVAGAPPCPAGAPFRKSGRGGWAAEGLWGYQEGQMGQNLPLCGQLGPTRSRQDESKEVGGRWSGVKTDMSFGGWGESFLIKLTRFAC
jgi:hypothetical protein